MWDENICHPGFLQLQPCCRAAVRRLQPSSAQFLLKSRAPCRRNASAGMIARDCERAPFATVSVISRDYLRYQGIDDNLLEKNTLYSINLRLRPTQAPDQLSRTVCFCKPSNPSRSLAGLIFESAPNTILQFEKHSSPRELLHSSPGRCFLPRQPAAGAGVWLLPGNYHSVFSSVINSSRSLQDGQGLHACARPRRRASVRQAEFHLLCRCWWRQKNNCHNSSQSSLNRG